MAPQGFAEILEFQKTEPTAAAEESPVDFAARRQKWLIMKIQAYATVDETCGYRASDILKKCKEANKSIIEAFDALEETFKGAGSTRYESLCNTLLDLSLATSKSVPDFGAKLQKVWSEMTALNEKATLPECFVVQHFLKGLGPQFHPFKTSFNMRFEVLPVEKEDNATDTIAATATTTNANAREPSTKEPVSLRRVIVLAEDFEASIKPADHQVSYNGRQDNGRPDRPKPCPTCWTRIPHKPGQVCWGVDDSKAPQWYKLRKEADKLRKESKEKKGTKREASPGVTVMGSAAKKPDTGVAINVFLGGLQIAGKGEAFSQDNVVYVKTNEPTGELMAIHRGLNLWNALILDSGASGGLVGRKDLFLKGTYESIQGVTANGIGGHAITPIGKGTLAVECKKPEGDETRWLHIPNVQYAPNAGVNLLSLNEMWPYIDSVSKPNNNSLRFKQGRHEFQASIKGGLMILDTTAWLSDFDRGQNFAGAAYSVEKPHLRLWHERLGHLSEKALTTLRSMVDGMDAQQPDGRCICEACVLGRQHERPHSGSLRTGEYPMDVVHTDIAGPFETAFDGTRYWVTHLDDYSQFAQVTPLKTKDEVFEHTRNFIDRYERLERRCRLIIQDRGGENVSHDYTGWAYDRAIELQYSDTDQHQANGKAERLNRSIEERLQPSLISSGLDPRYWSEVVVHHTTVVYNYSPCTKHQSTRWELFMGTRPNISHLRTLGSTVYVLKTPNQQQTEIDGFTGRKVTGKKSAIGKLLGFKGHFTYRVAPLYSEGRPVWRTNVVIRERRPCTESPEPGGQADIVDLYETDNESQAQEIQSTPPPLAKQRTELPPSKRRRFEYETALPKEVGVELDESNIIENRTRRNAVFHMQVHNLICLSLLAVALQPEPFEPLTLKQAQESYQWTKWQAACQAELDSLRNNKTWRLKKRSLCNGRVLRGKWVFKIKRGANGEILKYKARWVVRGFEQTEGSYNDTFASVVKPMSYKLLFAIAAALDYEIEQMDVATAFLYGDVEETVFVEQPTGFEEGGEDEVCELDKALYGLKQSPRIWYNTLAAFLKTLGYNPLDSDLSVFVKETTFVAVYVDDLLIVGPDKEAIRSLKEALNERFKMTDLGPCKFYLGMELRRDRANRTIYLNQRAYIKEVLTKYNLWSDTKTTGVPMTVKLEASPEGYVASEEMKVKYQSAVGSLMYAMLGTRPDIAYAVSAVSRYASNPHEVHWQAVIRIMRYLRGTIEYELVFSGPMTSLVGYSDSDWGGDSSRRSTSGFVFNVGSGAITWQSKRQRVVALSTCEAELVAMTQATKEAIWLRALLNELGHREAGATVIYGDNQGAIALSRNPHGYHGRSKHVDIQDKFVTQKVSDGTVDVQWTDTSQQVADGLTKPLPKEAFFKFRQLLGLQPRG